MDVIFAGGFVSVGSVGCGRDDDGDLRDGNDDEDINEEAGNWGGGG